MSPRAPSQTEAKLLEIQGRLVTWNNYVRNLQVPAELVPAFMTGRSELLRLAVPRALTATECKVLYDVIGGLIETNVALRDHAALVAELAQQLSGSLVGSLNAAQRLRSFAEYHEPTDNETDNEEVTP